MSLEEKRLSQTSEEVEKWLDFLFEVFPWTGRQYFARHLSEDPHTDFDFIFVLYEQQTIVSTVRVFVRKVYVDGTVYKIGGIGEVSTKLTHRGAGLASRLVRRTFDEMINKGYSLTTLHAGKAAPMYERLGYQAYPRSMSHFNVSFEALTAAESRWSSIKEFDFNDDADIQRLMELHWSFNTKLHFNGWFVRDDANYWKKWVKAESSKFLVLRDTSGVIVGFFNAKVYKKDLETREVLVLVQDFAIDFISNEIHMKDALFEFCAHWLLSKHEEIQQGGSFPSAEIMIPSPVIASQEYNDNNSGSTSTLPSLFNAKSDRVNKGTFYLQLDDKAKSLNLEKLLDASSHVFWATDDF